MAHAGGLCQNRVWILSKRGVSTYVYTYVYIQAPTGILTQLYQLKSECVSGVKFLTNAH